MMTENSLVFIFSMQPAYKSFVKVYNINREGNYVQRVLHVQFDLKFIENKDTDISKKYSRKYWAGLAKDGTKYELSR